MNVKHQLQCGLNLKKKVQNLNSTKKTFKLQVYRKNNFEDVGGIFNEIRKKFTNVIEYCFKVRCTAWIHVICTYMYIDKLIDCLNCCGKVISICEELACKNNGLSRWLEWDGGLYFSKDG